MKKTRIAIYALLLLLFVMLFGNGLLMITSGITLTTLTAELITVLRIMRCTRMAVISTILQ